MDGMDQTAAPAVAVDDRARLGDADAVVRFAHGEIGRKEAMRALGDVPYGVLIDRVGALGLTLPALSEDELDRMADTVVRLLDDADA